MRAKIGAGKSDPDIRSLNEGIGENDGPYILTSIRATAWRIPKQVSSYCASLGTLFIWRLEDQRFII